MSQTVDVYGVGPVEFPDEMSQDEIKSALEKEFDDHKSTAAEAFVGGAARGITPTAAFVAAAKPGASIGARAGVALGALVPGLGEIGVSEAVLGGAGALIGGVGAGSVAAWGAHKAQSALADKVAPESVFGSKAEARQSSEHPWATTAGDVASGAVSMRVEPGAIFKDTKKALTATALGVGIGGALPLLEGRLPTLQDVVAGGAFGLLYGKPRNEPAEATSADAQARAKVYELAKKVAKAKAPATADALAQAATIEIPKPPEKAGEAAPAPLTKTEPTETSDAELVANIRKRKDAEKKAKADAKAAKEKAEDESKATKYGRKKGDKYDDGMPEKIVTYEDKSTLNDEYTKKVVHNVISDTEIETRRVDMTPDEIKAHQERLARENDMRRELGLPEEPIPEVSTKKPSGKQASKPADPNQPELTAATPPASAPGEGVNTSVEHIVASTYTDESGKTRIGPNHPSILRSQNIGGFLTRESRNTPAFGFMTSEGRVVDRIEGGKIAEKANQKISDYDEGGFAHSDQLLHPEDPTKTLGGGEVPKEEGGAAVDEERKAIDDAIAEASATNKSLGLQHDIVEGSSEYGGARDAEGHQDDSVPFSANQTATINRKGQIEFFPEVIKKWLSGFPKYAHKDLIESLMVHEGIHAKARQLIGEPALADLWRSLTKAEQRLTEDAYLGPLKEKQRGNFSDSDMGHEYLRRLTERLMGLDSHEALQSKARGEGLLHGKKARAAGWPRLTDRAIDAIERVIQWLRSKLPGSTNAKLREMVGKMEANWKEARAGMEAEGSGPASLDRGAAAHADLDQVEKMDPEDVVAEAIKGGKGMTNGAYELGSNTKPEDRPRLAALESKATESSAQVLAEAKAAPQDERAPLLDKLAKAGMAKQYFTEALKFHDAQQAVKLGLPVADAARQFGVAEDKLSGSGPSGLAHDIGGEGGDIDPEKRFEYLAGMSFQDFDKQMNGLLDAFGVARNSIPENVRNEVFKAVRDHHEGKIKKVLDDLDLEVEGRKALADMGLIPRDQVEPPPPAHVMDRLRKFVANQKFTPPDQSGPASVDKGPTDFDPERDKNTPHGRAFYNLLGKHNQTLFKEGSGYTVPPKDFLDVLQSASIDDSQSPDLRSFWDESQGTPLSRVNFARKELASINRMIANANSEMDKVETGDSNYTHDAITAYTDQHKREAMRVESIIRTLEDQGDMESGPAALDRGGVGPKLVDDLEKLKLKPDREGKFNTSQLLSTLKNKLHPDEWGVYEDAGIASAFKDRVSPAVLSNWLAENGPRIVTDATGERDFNPHAEEMSDLRHNWYDTLNERAKKAIDSIWRGGRGSAIDSIWRGGRGSAIDKVRSEYGDEFVEKAKKYEELEAKYHKFESRQRLVSKVRQPTYQSVAHKPEDKMEGYVELSVVRPSKPQDQSLINRARENVRRLLEDGKERRERGVWVDHVIEQRLQEIDYYNEDVARYGANAAGGYVGGEFDPLAPLSEHGLDSERYYVSPHPGIPHNTLGWVRGNMETLPDGQKAFNVLEQQSDWEKSQDMLREHDKEYVSSSGDRKYERLVKHNETISVKAAIEHAKDNGASAIIIPDYKTAMMTEGHDRNISVRAERTFSSHEDAYKWAEEAKLPKGLSPLPKGLRPSVNGNKVLITGMGIGGEKLKLLRDLKYDGFSVIEDIPQEKGMRLHYGGEVMVIGKSGDILKSGFSTKQEAQRWASKIPRNSPEYPVTVTAGKLHDIAQELTGSVGEPVDLGYHKNAYEKGPMGQAYDRQGNPQQQSWGDVKREGLIIKNPNGTFKTNATGRKYDISKVGDLSLLGRDKFPQERPWTDRGPAGVDKGPTEEPGEEPKPPKYVPMPGYLIDFSYGKPKYEPKPEDRDPIETSRFLERDPMEEFVSRPITDDFYPGWNQFVDWAKGKMPGYNEAKLRGEWEKMVWSHLQSASGERLEQWRKAMNLEGAEVFSEAQKRRGLGTRAIASQANPRFREDAIEREKIEKDRVRVEKQVAKLREEADALDKESIHLTGRTGVAKKSPFGDLFAQTDQSRLESNKAKAKSLRDKADAMEATAEKNLADPEVKRGVQVESIKRDAEMALNRAEYYTEMAKRAKTQEAADQNNFRARIQRVRSKQLLKKAEELATASKELTPDRSKQAQLLLDKADAVEKELDAMEHTTATFNKRMALQVTIKGLRDRAKRVQQGSEIVQAGLPNKVERATEQKLGGELGDRKQQADQLRFQADKIDRDLAARGEEPSFGERKAAEIRSRGLRARADMLELGQNIEEGEKPVRLTEGAKEMNAAQRYRNKIISEVGRRLIDESKPDEVFDRKAVALDDIDFDNEKALVPAFHEIPNEARNLPPVAPLPEGAPRRNVAPPYRAIPKLLMESLKDAARRKNTDPVSVTKRLVALRHRSNGTVDLVSAWAVGGRKAGGKTVPPKIMAVDPQTSGINERSGRDLAKIMIQYEPTHSVLLREPTQHFHQHFATEADFQRYLAEDAMRESKYAYFKQLAEDAGSHLEAGATDPDVDPENKHELDLEGRPLPQSGVVSGEGGSFMGPGAKGVEAVMGTDKGTGLMERALREPITVPEILAVRDFVLQEAGTLVDPQDHTKGLKLMYPEDMRQAMEELVRQNDRVDEPPYSPTGKRDWNELWKQPDRYRLRGIHRQVILAITKAAAEIRRRGLQSEHPVDITESQSYYMALDHFWDAITGADYATDAKADEATTTKEYVADSLGRFTEPTRPAVKAHVSAVPGAVEAQSKGQARELTMRDRVPPTTVRPEQLPPGTTAIERRPAPAPTEGRPGAVTPPETLPGGAEAVVPRDRAPKQMSAGQFPMTASEREIAAKFEDRMRQLRGDPPKRSKADPDSREGLNVDPNSPYVPTERLRELPTTESNVGGKKFTGEPPKKTGQPRVYPHELAQGWPDGPASLWREAQDAKEAAHKKYLEGKRVLKGFATSRKESAQEAYAKTYRQLEAAKGRRSLKADIYRGVDIAERAAGTYSVASSNAIRAASMEEAPAGFKAGSLNPKTWYDQRGILKANKAEALKVRAATRAVISVGEKDGDGNWTPSKNLLQNRFNQLDEAERVAQAKIDSSARSKLGNIMERRKGKAWMKAINKLREEVQYAKDHWGPTESTVDNQIYELIKDEAEPFPKGSAGDIALAKLLEYKRGFANGKYDPATGLSMTLKRTVDATRKELQDQVDWERANGFSTKDHENYTPNIYEAEFFNDDRITFGERQLMGGKFRKPKTFDSVYSAIKDPDGPYIPASNDVADMVQHRVSTGRNMVERKAWIDSLKTFVDPISKEPISIEPTPVMGKMPVTGYKVDENTGKRIPVKDLRMTDPETGHEVSPGYAIVGYETPSKLYELVQVGSGKPLAIRKGYSNAVRVALETSKVPDFPGGKAALAATQVLKTGVLLAIDTFHPGRLYQYALAASGKKGGVVRPSGGFAAISWRPETMPEAVKKGLLSQASVDWALGKVEVNQGGTKVMVTRQDIANEFVRSGLNVSHAADALYRDALASVPIIGPGWHKGVSTINKAVFDYFVPGLMTETAVRNFERMNAQRPDIPLDALLKDVAKDTNIMFGNLGRQGVFKSATLRDMLQILFLAPMWQEALLQKEARFYARAPGMVEAAGRRGLAAAGVNVDPNQTLSQKLTGRQGLPAGGTLGRAMAGGIAGYFVLAQAINLISRRQLTFQNHEDEHKLDAWLPVGGEGAWLSPLSVFGETLHDYIRLGENKPAAMDRIRQIGYNKAGPMGRLAGVLLSGTSPTGQKLTSTWSTVKEAAAQVAPLPIALSPLIKVGAHAVLPGTFSPLKPGSMGQRLLGAVGIKAQLAQSPGQRLYSLADKFLKENDFKKETGWQQVQTDEESYSKLRSALRSNDPGEAQRQLKGLMKSRSLEQIWKAMQLAARRPVTGNKKYEPMFVATLDEQDLELYNQSRAERYETLEKFIELLGDIK